jgi:class 3 adenylate cyclase
MAEIRKIAAILAADIVGFSRMASVDEDRTLARMRALRSDLIDPTVAVHNGRVVKRTGDGLIVDFRSVVDGPRRPDAPVTWSRSRASGRSISAKPEKLTSSIFRDQGEDRDASSASYRRHRSGGAAGPAHYPYPD